MNYQIITNKHKLEDFINWLPELQPNEKYYLSLFARKKYVTNDIAKYILKPLTSDKCQLKRFTSDKARLLSKIKQLEVPLGSYMQGNLEIPQEALALYITVNPRNMYKATINTMVKLAESIRDNNVIMNPHQEALSEIQKSKGTTHYVDFDIDESNEEKLPSIIEEIKLYVNEDAVTWLKTRGGMHVLINVSKINDKYRKTYFRDIAAMNGIDQKGDLLIPVVGTYQGGYTPTFVEC